MEAARARSTIMTAVKLCVDIFHLAGGLHLPRLDGIVVKDGVGAMRADQGVARRLDGTAVVGGAALQYGRKTVPSLIAGSRSRRAARRVPSGQPLLFEERISHPARWWHL
jgi:hypothetical protein